MTSTSLREFIFDNVDVEYCWQTNTDSDVPKRDVLLFVHMIDIRGFQELLTESIFDVNNIIKCKMTKNYFTFWMSDICKHYRIDLETVFGKDKNIYG